MSISFFPRELVIRLKSIQTKQVDLASSVVARPHALKFASLTFKNLTNERSTCSKSKVQVRCMWNPQRSLLVLKHHIAEIICCRSCYHLRMLRIGQVPKPNPAVWARSQDIRTRVRSTRIQCVNRVRRDLGIRRKEDGKRGRKSIKGSKKQQPVKS